MSIRSNSLHAFGLSLLTLVASPAFAEAPQAKPSVDSGRRAPSSFKSIRADILRKTLGMEEKGATAVEQILDRYAPQRKGIRQLIEAEKRALDDLLATDSSDQAAYKRALDTLASQQLKLNVLRQTEQVELAKWMTPKQQARLLAVMEKTRRAKRGD